MSLIVTTTAGPVVGFVDTHRLSVRSTAQATVPGDRAPIRKWLGIPYAQAGRWKRATDPQPWQSPRDCFEFGPVFPQMGNPFDALYQAKENWRPRLFVGQSEDAFTVNVFAPSADVNGLPVIVWLYGGNFNSGGSSFPAYDPSEFVRQQWEDGQPCVVVTGNYRVGIFGFLSTDDLAQINRHPGNFGLHDCIRMLEWTRKNIAAFGGDPDNVTAMGESAGAFAIATLFHSGRRLFNRAILESGSHGVMFYRQKPSFPYEKLLALLGIDSNGTPEDKVGALRDIPMPLLRDTVAQLFYPDMWGITFDPNEEGWKSSVWAQLDQGEYDPWIESAIITINKDEGTFFSNRGKGSIESCLYLEPMLTSVQWWEESRLLNVLKARGLYTNAMYPEFQRLYPNAPPGVNNIPLTDIGSSRFFHDQVFLTPLHHFARALSSVPNRESGRRMGVFVCQFNCIPSALFKDLESLGALHTGEIPFVFNMSSLWSYDDESPDAKTARSVGRSWASFAQSGDPGWPAYSPSVGEGIEVNEGGVRVPLKVNELRKKYREFWFPIMEQLFS